MTASDDFAVFRSSAGLGLRSRRDYRKGESIIEYTGPKITNDEADERPNRYLFRLDDEWTIDGSPRSNIARYINHSCRPNARAVHDEKANRVFIEAIRRIRPGDEITYNYGREYFESYIEPAGCRCAACADD